MKRPAEAVVGVTIDWPAAAMAAGLVAALALPHLQRPVKISPEWPA